LEIVYLYTSSIEEMMRARSTFAHCIYVFDKFKSSKFKAGSVKIYAAYTPALLVITPFLSVTVRLLSEKLLHTPSRPLASALAQALYEAFIGDCWRDITGRLFWSLMITSASFGEDLATDYWTLLPNGKCSYLFTEILTDIALSSHFMKLC
jgi:hypothetical protein